MADMKQMTVGQIVDMVISYNNRQKQAEKQAKQVSRRKATQNDINAFFG